MTDIVERLRRNANAVPMKESTSIFMLEAADEIERLRAEIEALHQEMAGADI